MKIIICRFSGARRIPVLFSKDAHTPYFLPLTYTVLNLKSKSYKTKFNNITAIKHFYTFFHENRIDFEELIITGAIKTIYDYLDTFSSWLYNKQYLNSSCITPTSNQFYDILMSAIKNYLSWACSRYDSSRSYLQMVINKFDSSLLSSSSYRKKHNGLSDPVIKKLKEIVRPDSTSNPFKEKNRLRNWLIVEIFLVTGLRCGELLKLKTLDFIKLGNYYYISIIRRDDDAEDTRKSMPSIKNSNSERTIAIPDYIFLGFQNYLKVRRGVNKERKINHGYLFISERGNPLSQNMVNEIFNVLNSCLSHIFPINSHNLTPHTLRHTFAEKMLQFLIEEKDVEMERAKDELRNICGWHINSTMPQHYASNYISKTANKHNQERIQFALEKHIHNGL